MAVHSAQVEGFSLKAGDAVSVERSDNSRYRFEVVQAVGSLDSMPSLGADGPVECLDDQDVLPPGSYVVLREAGVVVKVGPPKHEWKSWRDLAACACELGTPHFQRGQVWEQSNVTALLESMLEGSPCGSMVLWTQPNDPNQEPSDVGFALVAGNVADVRHWLVDGQQRTRALLGIVWDIAHDGDDLASKETQEALKPFRHTDDGGTWRIPPVYGSLPEENEDALPPHDGATSGSSEPVLEPDEQDPDDVDELESNSPENAALGERQSEMRPVLPPRTLEVRANRPSAPTKTWFVSIPRLCVPLGEDAADWLKKALSSGANVSPFRLSGRRTTSLTANSNPPPGSVGLMPMSFVWAVGGDLAGIDLAAAAEDPSKVPWAARCVSGYDTTWEGLLEAKREGKWRERWADVVKLLRSKPCREKLLTLVRGPHFAVGYLPPENDLGDTVSAYVRINRAGVRVRAEERAFAALVRLWPGTAKELRNFSEAQDRRMWCAASAAEEDVVQDRRFLAHAHARSFGFFLWIHTAARCLALKFVPGSAAKSSWLGPDALEKPSLRDQLKEPEVKQACEHATSILKVVDHVLAEYLGFDNPMGLPDSTFLQPVIDLLYRCPELRGAGSDRDSILGPLLLWLVSYPRLTQVDLVSLLESVPQKHGGDTAGMVKGLTAAIAKLYGAPDVTFGEQVKCISKLAAEKFEKQVGEAVTLRDRAVALLYGLERRRRGEQGAREFVWKQPAIQVNRKRNASPSAPLAALALQARWAELPKEGASAEDLRLERQHMVPFSVASKWFGTGSNRNRASDSSFANLEPKI